MGIQSVINGQVIELGQTRPDGLAIGKFNSNRKLMVWVLPTKGSVQMYVNPQTFTISEAKLVKETRTKGGYVIQYWGESLPQIDIAGTTGSGGIEGINVLRDVYRQEQVGFNDVIAQLNSGFLSNLFQTALGSIQNLANNPLASTVNALTGVGTLFNDVVTTVGNIANVFDSIGSAIGVEQQLIPTLAALATSVELHFDGQIFRGFFKDFRVDERAEEPGIFRYTIKFTVTRRTGIRLNGFSYQRTVDAGPANSDSVPLSFGGLVVPGTSVALPPATTVATPPPSASRRSLLTGG